MISNKTSVAKLWIDAGANLNAQYASDKVVKANLYDGDEIGDEERVKLMTNPLIVAIGNANLDLVKHMISKGVDLKSPGPAMLDSKGRQHVNYVLFAAVNSSISKRKDKKRAHVLKALVEAGLDGNVVEGFSKRTALHLAVNSSTDGADQSLDLEIALLRNGADVCALDVRGRLPLHYCFVKIGRHADHSRSDPIEICSMLVEAMRGAEVDTRDEFLSTPLHYAAFRGAAVCCLLLLERGADIEAVDRRGNTPLAYAVLGGHEGCALVLLQKEANLNVTIYPKMMEEPRSSEEEDRFEVDRFSFIPSHFERDRSAEPHSLFQGLVQNDWLGVTYMALQQLEAFGMSYSRAVEVALKMQKVQFAKTLIGKQALVERLREKVGGGRNLLCCMAYECKADSDPEIQVDILELLTGAGIAVTETDERLSTPLHLAAMRHNHVLIKALLAEESEPEASINEFKMTPLAAAFWNYEKTSNMRKTVAELMNAGADPNIILPCKEFSYLQGLTFFRT